MYDINPNLCKPPNTTLNDICNCDLIFISVPTPSNRDGSINLDILQDVLFEMKANHILL